MNLNLVSNLLKQLLEIGIKEFCVCPGSRNSPFISCLAQSPEIIKHYWYEERSAGFFGLGRARSTQRPVAVLTTSGTAVGELLPSTMEAYYTGAPLLLLTADRPRRFRGTGAPQAAEQKGIFGVYTPFSQDLEGDESCKIACWDQKTPAHLNVCLEEPTRYSPIDTPLQLPAAPLGWKPPIKEKPNEKPLDDFLANSLRPLVLVTNLPPEAREAVAKFLLQLGAPVYCESGSGLREDPRLEHLRISSDSFAWELSKKNGYIIDGFLRIGDVPVTRLWRDLEEREGSMTVCSLSELPFSGLSWGKHTPCSLKDFFSAYRVPSKDKTDFSSWMEQDSIFTSELERLFAEEPLSEPALINGLSSLIPDHSLVYLGNSLPVREWDMASTRKPKGFQIASSRGLNGIDGQISTFLGLASPDCSNWAILGDLTALYDFAALWVVDKLPEMDLKIVVINNGGGKIFSRIYKDSVYQNPHNLGFESFAKMWRIPYVRSKELSNTQDIPLTAFVELIPDEKATIRFWKAHDELKARI